MSQNNCDHSGCLKPLLHWWIITKMSMILLIVIFQIPSSLVMFSVHGSLIRYVELRVAHASGMPATFSLPPTSKETANWQSRHASRHVRQTRAVMHVGIANPRWQGKRSWHYRRIRTRNISYLVRGSYRNQWRYDKITGASWRSSMGDTKVL